MNHAKDEKCCNCGEQAVCYWPMVDPDIPHHPFCRKYVDEAKARFFLLTTESRKRYRNWAGMK